MIFICLDLKRINFKLMQKLIKDNDVISLFIESTFGRLHKVYPKIKIAYKSILKNVIKGEVLILYDLKFFDLYT